MVNELEHVPPRPKVYQFMTATREWLRIWFEEPDTDHDVSEVYIELAERNNRLIAEISEHLADIYLIILKERSEYILGRDEPTDAALYTLVTLYRLAAKWPERIEKELREYEKRLDEARTAHEREREECKQGNPISCKSLAELVEETQKWARIVETLHESKRRALVLAAALKHAVEALTLPGDKLLELERFYGIRGSDDEKGR